MIYELTTLAYRGRDAKRVEDGVLSWTGEGAAAGRLLGCWETENGQLFRLNVLRGFDDRSQLAVEQDRARHSRDPFAAHGALTGLDMVAYAPFPFLPDVETGRYGPVYEIRTYHLAPGGLPATLAGWEAAVPERVKLSPLTIAMYSLDGPVRISHIWPYASHDARARIRRDASERGIWPPASGPEQISEATSTIAIPMAFSPLA